MLTNVSGLVSEHEFDMEFSVHLLTEKLWALEASLQLSGSQCFHQTNKWLDFRISLSQPHPLHLEEVYVSF